ncbi:MAG: c-type cytochrome [Chloroflexi bacterium]|nr:c-type cytochrome [Chloroflexota bacterium]MBV9601197.1 c-type cytochrome [Chloroflexota bacterium]
MESINVPALITAVFLLLVLGAVLWYAARVAVPLPEAPAGPPTGALAMERKIIAIVAMLAAMALLFLGYGFREPARQVQAQEQQLDTSIDRGIGSFTTLCFPCHGEKGQGAIVPDSNPQRLAPALDRADLRPTDADTRTKEYDFIFKTIQRGRPGTPMPTWGQIDGGPLLDEQINELTLMIMNGDQQVDYEGKEGTPWQHTSDVITANVAAGLVQMPQQPDVTSQPFYQQLNAQQQQGVTVILQRGCGGCHTIPNIPGAAGTIGPNLGPHDNVPPVSQRPMIATYPNGTVPNNSVDDLSKWIMNPQALKPGTAMPTLGLSQDEATAAAAYLYSITTASQ